MQRKELKERLTKLLVTTFVAFFLPQTQFQLMILLFCLGFLIVGHLPFAFIAGMIRFISAGKDATKLLQG